ncbi:putative lipid-transfer protein DIR1, partial [Cucurbita argyrosperma subsp. sororia]
MKAVVGALALVLIAMIGLGEAQTICNMSFPDIFSCSSSVMPPNPTPPTTQCCTALLHADLTCLCNYQKTGAFSYLGIDPNLALQLPNKCNIPNPPTC